MENKNNKNELKWWNEDGEYVPVDLVGKYQHPYHLPWFSVFAPVVPYVWDGSLSMLEMVHKLMHYINKVNHAVNLNHTDILNLAEEVERLAGLIESLPAYIERLEQLLAELPPLYLVKITQNENTAILDRSIDEINAAISEGKIPVAWMNDSNIGFYDVDNARFEFIVNEKFTYVENIFENEGHYAEVDIITEKGGVVTGLLQIVNAPTNNIDAVNKLYVDTAITNNKMVIVNVTKNGDEVSADKTFNEIKTAIEDKRVVICVSNTLIYQLVGYNDAVITFFYNNAPSFAGIRFMSNGRIIADNYRNFITQSGSATTNQVDNTLLLNYTISQAKQAVTKEYVDNLIDTVEGDVEGSKPLLVTFTLDGESLICDRNVSDIVSAYNDNRVIIGIYGNTVLQLNGISDNKVTFNWHQNGAYSYITNVGDTWSKIEGFYPTRNGTVNNEIATELRLLYTPTIDEHAVNKGYVDERMPWFVEFSNENDVIVCDKTNAEIFEAYSSGKYIVGKYQGNKYDLNSANATGAYFVAVYAGSLFYLRGINDVWGYENTTFPIRDGSQTINTLSSPLFLSYTVTDESSDEIAVNKAYVDTNAGNIALVNYDLSALTCDKTNAEIRELISEGKIVIAHTNIENNESWGYLVTISNNNLRFVCRTNAGKNTFLIKHESNDTIATQTFNYLTSNGGTVSSGVLTIDGTRLILNVDASSIIPANKQAVNVETLKAVNKEITLSYNTTDNTWTLNMSYRTILNHLNTFGYNMSVVYPEGNNVNRYIFTYISNGAINFENWQQRVEVTSTSVNVYAKPI